MLFRKEKKSQEPSEKRKKPRANISGLLDLWPFFRPYLKSIIAACIALLITSFTILLFGKAIKYLIDYGFAKQDSHLLNMALLSFVAITAVMAIAGYYRSSIVNSVTEKAIADLRKKAYAHTVTISAEFFEVFKVGDVISRLTVDTTLLYSVISTSVSFLLRNLLLFIGGICFLLFASVKLTAISIILIIFAITPIVIMGRKIKNLSNKSQESLALVGSHIEETVNGIKTIQSHLCEEKEIKNFQSFVDKSLTFSLKKISLKSSLVAVVIALSFCSIAAVLWVGGHDVLNGKMTPGDLSSFLFYSVITATSLVALSQISGQLQTASAASQRIFDLLKTQSPVKQGDDLQNLPVRDNLEVSFENVTFSYPSRKDLAILEEFNLTIKPGEKIAVVGSSGTGKSTIMQLLLRFYDVVSGSISLNGIDIRKLSFADLRHNFSYISQDCFIFSGTIFDNIAYIDKNITEEKVQKIIDDNDSLHFINNLPNKMHSFVGEKGIKLSGGERQRIAIARAIIKDSPILLLDEATSALDSENAKIIDQAITDFSKDKTVITIAHRLSSITSSDRIIFIKDGKIVETGTHKELLSKQGFYEKMYEAETTKF